jgi:hypothetical protein
VKRSFRRDKENNFGVKEIRSPDDIKKWNREWRDIKGREKTRENWYKDRKDIRRRSKYGGYYERKCCYSWIEEECFFEPKPWGWWWGRRDLRRAARRAGYPWLRFGDECYDYRNNWRLRDFCYCTRERFRQCVWTDVNLRC